MSLFFKRDLDWDDVYAGWTTGSSFSSARNVKALRLVAVYAAVSLIADLFSTLPQSRYREDAGRHTKLPLPEWLAKPDPRISLFSWRYQFVTSLKLRGNAYGLVMDGSGGKPVGVRWLHPDSVRVDELDPTGPRYYVAGRAEPLTLYSQGGQIIHVPEFVQPGSVVGLSPIEQFRKVFETAEYAVDYGHDWFETSAIPKALLMAKRSLKPGQAAEAKTLFRSAVADGGPVTLDMDWDYKQLTIAPNESQFLETIKASSTLIANIFRVSPEDIGGETGSSKTYGNRQDDFERFNVRTMLPTVVRYELAMKALLPEQEFIKANLDALVRPNLLERSRANTENLKNGTLTLAEARGNEDRPMLTPEEVEFWHEHYLTTNSVSESNATSLALTVSEQVADLLAKNFTKEE
ncbi:MAG: phage portal protein [Microcella sp.]|uniref:phage portal protein n=1 Tax=Microcella sp. TaxID=1913979 RepID=UPI0033160D66